MAVETASAATVAEAARLIQAGRLVAFPTETVYGLGADATNGQAVARIYEAKGRPRFNPLIAHVASLAAAERLAELGRVGRALAEQVWPGPLTLVARRRPDCAVSQLVSAGLDSIAVRVPAHPVALALIEAAGLPLAAPSANRSGHVSPTTAAHVAADLGDGPAMILDGGPCLHGLESTILDVTTDPATLLRAGALTAEAIERALGARVARPAAAADRQRPTAPGQLQSHYAPRAALRLAAADVAPGEALLAFGPDVPRADGPILNLSPSGDLVEAAANLFAALRSLDALQPRGIAVMPVPERGLGEAINDRLRRAAAPRPAEEPATCD